MSGKSARDYEDKYTRPRLRARLKEEIKQSQQGWAQRPVERAEEPAARAGVRKAGRRLQGREEPKSAEPRPVDR